MMAYQPFGSMDDSNGSRQFEGLSTEGCVVCMQMAASCLNHAATIAWATGKAEALQVVNETPDASSVIAALSILNKTLEAIASSFTGPGESIQIRHRRAKMVVVHLSQPPLKVTTEQILDTLDHTIPHPCTRAGHLSPTHFYAIASQDTVSGLHYKTEITSRLKALFEHENETQVAVTLRYGQILDNESIREAAERLLNSIEQSTKTTR